MFGIVYSKTTGRMRSVIVPDNDNQLNNIPLNTGESFMTFDNSSYDTLDNLQILLSSKTGITPNNDRYAIVDQINNVVGVILADPNCGDTIAGHTLIQTNQAEKGWTYNPATGFSAPLITL